MTHSMRLYAKDNNPPTVFYKLFRNNNFKEELEELLIEDGKRDQFIVLKQARLLNLTFI